MKNKYRPYAAAAALMLLAGGPLFSFEPSALEKRIVMASPDEMLALVSDAGLEEELRGIYLRYEENQDELAAAWEAAFPGLSSDETLALLFKLGLVTSLGSGDRELVYKGVELLMFCLDLNAMYTEGGFEEEILPDQKTGFLGVLGESRYWKDCVEFGGRFNAENFLMERYPGDFSTETEL